MPTHHPRLFCQGRRPIVCGFFTLVSKLVGIRLVREGSQHVERFFILKVHQQHAFDLCFSNHGLLLLHGPEGPLPSWVSDFPAHHALLT